MGWTDQSEEQKNPTIKVRRQNRVFLRKTGKLRSGSKVAQMICPARALGFEKVMTMLEQCDGTDTLPFDASIAKRTLVAVLFMISPVVVAEATPTPTTQEQHEAVGPTPSEPPRHMQLNDLLGKSGSERDALFRSSEAGPIPEGNASGEAIGPLLTRLFARFVHDVAWQGKVFSRHPDGTTTLVNKLGPEGDKDVKADVYYTESWLDGKKCIILDYRHSTRWARKIRDEIRLADPATRLYLGVVFWGKTRLIDFALQFPAQPLPAAR